MGRDCCTSGRAAEVPAPRAGAEAEQQKRPEAGRGCAHAAAAAGSAAPSADGAAAAAAAARRSPPLDPPLPLAALVAAPLASIVASALPAVQGAVQGAGDAVGSSWSLLVATALPPLLLVRRRLDGGGGGGEQQQQQQQQQQRRRSRDDDSSGRSKQRQRGGARGLLPTLSARDVAAFRALARAGGEVGSGLLSLGGLAAVAAVSRMSPCGPGCCDGNRLERAANVLTSLPYVAVGLRAASRRRTPEGRTWGLSMAAVGAASMFFHATRGPLKEVGRKMDYWAISASSALLCRALRPGGGVPRRLTAASLAATPFRPFPVSTLNTLAMELEFLRRAAANGGPGGQSEGLRGQQLAHSACALGAVAFFSLEEVFPRAPLLHSTWHLLSSVSCATTNALLEDVERDMGLAPPAGGGGGGSRSAAAGATKASSVAAAASGRASLEMYVVPLEA